MQIQKQIRKTWKTVLSLKNVEFLLVCQSPKNFILGWNFLSEEPNIFRQKFGESLRAPPVPKLISPAFSDFACLTNLALMTVASWKSGRENIAKNFQFAR